MNVKRTTALPFVLLLGIVIAVVIVADQYARQKSDEPVLIRIRSDLFQTEQASLWQFEADEDLITSDVLKADTLFASAVDAYRENRLSSAEDFFEMLSNKYPRQPLAKNYLGLIRLKKDDIRLAQRYFENACSLDSTFVPALINLALVHTRAQNYVLADSSYALALQYAPANSTAWLDKGIMHCRIEEWQKSADALDRAISFSSGRQKAKAATYRGMVAFNLGDTAAAISFYNEATNLAPDYVLPRIYRALTLADDQKRLTEIQKIIALRPDYAPAHYYKGVVEAKMGLNEKAQSSIERALQLNPADRDLSELLGSFYIENDLIKRAENYFKQVYAQDSLVPQQFFYKAKIASRTGDLETAVDEYGKAIEMAGGNFAEAYLNKGILLKQLNRYDEAMEAYSGAIAARPGYEAAWYNMALLHRSMNNDRAAIDCYLKALEINPQAVKSYYNLGKVYSDLGQTDDAIQAWQKLLTIDPEYHTAWYNIGVVQLQLNRHEAAKETYISMLSRFPNYTKAWFNLGIARAELGDLDGAIEAYERAIDLDPTYIAAWKNLGNIYAEQEQLEQAILHYRQALDIDNSDAELRFNLALQFEKQGALSEALVHLNKAVRLRPDYLKAIEKWVELAEAAGDDASALQARAKMADLKGTPEAYYETARDFHRADQYRLALDYYALAEAAGKSGPWVIYWQGKARLEQNNLDDAETLFLRALEVDNTHKYSLYRLMQLYQQQSDPKAARYKNQLQELYPEFADEKGI